MSVMGLHASLAKMLRAGSRFYQERADCFVHNPVIREAWLLLAHDMQQQARSLESLPPDFWREFHSSEREIISNIEKCSFIKARGYPCDTVPLQDSIVRTLSFEEPVILGIFAPLIRRLRLAWIERALDFYVMVKAHVARLTHLVRTYSSDPVLIQRGISLLGAFEQEVQKPAASAAKKVEAARRTTKRKPAAQVSKRTGSVAARKAAKAVGPPLAGRMAAAAKGAKPLIRVTRRRAGR